MTFDDDEVHAVGEVEFRDLLFEFFERLGGESDRDKAKQGRPDGRESHCLLGYRGVPDGRRLRVRRLVRISRGGHGGITVYTVESLW